MKFREAVHSATLLAMEADPAVFLIGVGITSPRSVWATLEGAIEKFGPDRVVEGPLAEEALTGMCLGAAAQGMRPILVHHRMDFVMLSINQIVNHAAHWRSMFGGRMRMPLVIRAVVGRGWGNGPQHTASHHAMFARIPGLKTVVPADPEAAKGLFLAAVQEDGPVIYIEHRWLHEDEASVPEGPCLTPIGKARVLREGSDVTLAAVGPMVTEAVKAADALKESGLSAEVIDIRTLRPLDTDTLLGSAAKTGRLVVADADWGPCGISGEVIALAAERIFDSLKASPRRVTWPDSSVPSSMALEEQFYPGAQEIQKAALEVCEQDRGAKLVRSTVKQFEGPF